MHRFNTSHDAARTGLLSIYLNLILEFQRTDYCGCNQY
jgi:hypothetical protein